MHSPSLWWHDAENLILAEEVVLLLAHFNRFAAEFWKKHRVAALDVCERIKDDVEKEDASVERYFSHE